jgi:hypothetical protein
LIVLFLLCTLPLSLSHFYRSGIAISPDAATALAEQPMKLTQPHSAAEPGTQVMMTGKDMGVGLVAKMQQFNEALQCSNRLLH